MRFLLLWCILICASSFGSTRTKNNFTSVIENEFIVVLKPQASILSFKAFDGGGGEVLRPLSIINGMLVKMDKSKTLQVLKDPSVAYIEPNKRMYALAEQSNPPWGLDRIDSKKGLDSKYIYSKTGAGVNVYVVDTGIRASHSEFSGRVRQGFDAVEDGNGTNDCHGHGSHVSGTIMGKTYGVAKNAVVYPVRVLDCQGSGSDAGVISGIEWVANNAKRPAVANMSLGGSFSQAVNDAVTAAINRGVVFVVAAGNSSDDACDYSPASTPAAITVAASDKNDASASFTSFGSCVDTFAPGVSILSVGIGNDQDTDTMSGTSMASPHTAGVAALYLESEPNATPKQISDKVVSLGTKNVITNPKGSPNVLVYTNPTATPTPPVPPTPPPTDPTTPPECAKQKCYYKKSSLPNSATYDIHPIEYLYVPTSKTLKAFVKGDANFDLYMYAHVNGNWNLLAKSDSDSGNETISYEATGNYYYSWIVILRSPNTTGGTYSIWITN